MLSPLAKANLGLLAFAFRKVPLIWMTRPRLLAIDGEQVQVKLPLNRRNKNHLNSMYFGALAVGADVAGGFLAMHKAHLLGKKVSLAFKSVQGDFLKRPEADAVFVCKDGALIDDMLARSIETGERINESVEILVYCPSLQPDEVMARFALTLSVKVKV
jgi:acyl-coenzyme A thioesterase PaaI-like protein